MPLSSLARPRTLTDTNYHEASLAGAETAWVGNSSVQVKLTVCSRAAPQWISVPNNLAFMIFYFYFFSHTEWSFSITGMSHGILEQTFTPESCILHIHSTCWMHSVEENLMTSNRWTELSRLYNGKWVHWYNYPHIISVIGCSAAFPCALMSY